MECAAALCASGTYKDSEMTVSDDRGAEAGGSSSYPGGDASDSIVAARVRGDTVERGD